MKIYRLFPLIAALALGCKSDDTTSDSGSAVLRPVLTADQQVAIDQELAGQEIGKLLSGKVSVFRDDHYQKAPPDRAPDLYLFYYTASW